MASEDAILIFDDVTFSWQGGAEPLFRALNWRVPYGAAICLTAPSGNGKSTLLKLAAGLLKADSGRIAANWDRTGFLFQEHQLLPWLTAAENIMFALGGAENAKVIARNWLERLGLSDCADSCADQLSGGQQSRVNLARALAVAPEMLFLDEPFTGIDEAAIEVCAAAVRDWKAADARRTLIMTSHISRYAELCGASALPLAQIRGEAR